MHKKLKKGGGNSRGMFIPKGGGGAVHKICVPSVGFLPKIVNSTLDFPQL